MLPLESKPEVISEENGLSLVMLSGHQLEHLSHFMHTQRSICGGFLNVEVQMEGKRIPLNHILQWAQQQLPPRIPLEKQEPSYPAQVEAALRVSSLPRYQEFMQRLTAFPDRYAAGENGAKAAEWLHVTALQLAQSTNRPDVTALRVATGGAYIQPSIVVKIAGSEPTLPGIVVGAHMDTYRNQKPGADDDGSGTGAVMEIYNSILQSGLKFKRDIYFMFYAAEEWGLIGSQKVVQQFEKRRIELRSVLQFDMIGYKSARDPKDMYFIMDYTNLELTRFLQRLAVQYVGIPPDRVGETTCGYGCSDHAAWHKAGYKAAFPFEASFANHNRTLHTAQDTLELFNWPHAMRYVQLGIAYIVELADPL